MSAQCGSHYRRFSVLRNKTSFHATTVRNDNLLATRFAISTAVFQLLDYGSRDAPEEFMVLQEQTGVTLNGWT